MPTRTRVRKPAGKATDQEQMPLDANAGVAATETETGDAGNGETGEQFYDSQATPLDPVDDGSQDGELLPPEGSTTFPDGTESGDIDDDPTPKDGLGRTTAGMTEGQQAAAAELRNYLERLERLAEEQQAIKDDIKDVMTEAKGRGYDVPAIRTLLKLRSKDPAKLREQMNMLRLYAGAIGMDEDLV